MRKKKKRERKWMGVYGGNGHDDHPANDFVNCIVFYMVCVVVSVWCMVYGVCVSQVTPMRASSHIGGRTD